jgi:hypothetical protein
MFPDGKEPVIRAAGTSLQMRSKREGFYKPRNKPFYTASVVLLDTIASQEFRSCRMDCVLHPVNVCHFDHLD